MRRRRWHLWGFMGVLHVLPATQLNTKARAACASVGAAEARARAWPDETSGEGHQDIRQCETPPRLAQEAQADAGGSLADLNPWWWSPQRHTHITITRHPSLIHFTDPFYRLSCPYSMAGAAKSQHPMTFASWSCCDSSTITTAMEEYPYESSALASRQWASGRPTSTSGNSSTTLTWMGCANRMCSSVTYAFISPSRVRQLLMHCGSHHYACVLIACPRESIGNQQLALNAA